jgi:uncharacterized protein (DUF58 family)
MSRLRDLWYEVRDTGLRTWQYIRGFRRISFTRFGLLFSAATLGVGFAAINTGNNLLYLLLGAMLGVIVVSGWLSERVVGGVRVRRLPVRSVPVGEPARFHYRIESLPGRIPTLALEIQEKDLPESAFLPYLAPEEEGRARAENAFVHRGVHQLGTVTLRTGFPFGLFTKERDIRLPGELIILPRSDRRVREPAVSGGRRRARGPAVIGAPGGRGEYRNLREYRPGDDPRDIHWRSTARVGAPLVREYERDGAMGLWICLDLAFEPGDEAEAAVEVAASLAVQAERTGRRYGLASATHAVEPGNGATHLDALMEALARVDFDPSLPAMAPPADPFRCVLVTAGLGRGAGGFADVLRPREASA